MGAGAFPAGMGPAGADPVYQPPYVAPVLSPRAAFYDPSVKQLVLTNAQGMAVDVHPVDQIVAFRLCGQQGDSASSTTLGTRIRARFQLSARSKHKQIAFSEVSNQLLDLIQAGDVELVGVDLTINPANGAQVVIPTYVNLRDPKTDPKNPIANANNGLRIF